MWGRRTAPHPGRGMAVEVRCSDPGDVGDVVIVGQGLSSEGFAPEDPPPSLNQVQPRRSHRDEGMPDPRVGFEPVPDRTTGVAGEVVGDQVQVPGRIGAVQRLEQLQLAAGIAGASRLGQRLPIPHAQGALDPDFLWPAIVVERDLDAVPIG